MPRILISLKVPIILIGLCLTIFAPSIIGGMLDLKNAQAAYNNLDYVQAAPQYESAARRLGWKPELWEQAGISYENANDPEHAIRLFDIARQRGVLSAVGWDYFGKSYLSLGQDGPALEIWMVGLKQYPTYTRFYSDLALVYRGSQDYRAEQDALEVWLATGEGSALEHYELGQLLMTSDPDRSLQELLRASALDPEFSSVVQTLHTSLSLAGLEPDASRRLVIIGRGLGLVEEWGLASGAFEKAVNLEQGNALAWAWLGEADQHQGQDGGAQLDKALYLDPGDPIVHALRALYWKRKGRFAITLAEYQKAAGIEPENPSWQVSIGESYALTGDLVLALDAYQKATSLAPHDATYWRLLAMFCSDNGVQVGDIGLPAARKAFEIAPDDPQVLDALGWSYLNAGFLYNAQQNLLKAIELEPRLAIAHIHLAETYLRVGDRSSAFIELNNARQLDADGPSGQLAAQLLKQYFP